MLLPGAPAQNPEPHRVLSASPGTARAVLSLWCCLAPLRPGPRRGQKPGLSGEKSLRSQELGWGEAVSRVRGAASAWLEPGPFPGPAACARCSSVLGTWLCRYRYTCLLPGQVCYPNSFKVNPELGFFFGWLFFCNLKTVAQQCEQWKCSRSSCLRLFALHRYLQLPNCVSLSRGSGWGQLLAFGEGSPLPAAGCCFTEA